MTKEPIESAAPAEQELQELRFRDRWGKMGKGLVYAVTAAVAAYGAIRDSGEKRATEAKTEVEAAYKANSKAIAALQGYAKANADEISDLKKTNDAVIQRVAQDFKNEIAKLQLYTQGYLAALSRTAVGSSGAQKAQKEVEQLRKQVSETSAQLKMERARRGVAAAALRRLKPSHAPRPVLKSLPKNVRDLIKKK